MPWGFSEFQYIIVKAGCRFRWLGLSFLKYRSTSSNIPCRIFSFLVFSFSRRICRFFCRYIAQRSPALLDRRLFIIAATSSLCQCRSSFACNSSGWCFQSRRWRLSYFLCLYLWLHVGNGHGVIDELASINTRRVFFFNLFEAKLHKYLTRGAKSSPLMLMGIKWHQWTTARYQNNSYILNENLQPRLGIVWLQKCSCSQHLSHTTGYNHHCAIKNEV